MIDRAMADAVRSVEARERGGEGAAGASDSRPGEDEDADASGPPEPAPEAGKKSAADAVAESLLKAKRELEEVLKQTQEEAKSLRDKWLRAAADLENYRKRAAREREEVEKFGNERMLRAILPVLDDLDRSIQSAQTGLSSDDARTTALIDGIKLVMKKFLDQLEKHGVTTFQSEGAPFDPNTQEAVQQVNSDKPVGTVVNQLQRGYMLSGRLLRPALVTVSLGPAQATAPEAKKEQG